MVEDFKFCALRALNNSHVLSTHYLTFGNSNNLYKKKDGQGLTFRLNFKFFGFDSHLH